MKEKYKNIGTPTIIVIEECSELIHILCKTERFGIDNYHPEDVQMTPNRTLIQLEIDDVREALNKLEKFLGSK